MTNIPRESRPDDLPELVAEGDTWSDRPFLPGTEGEEVCFEQYRANVNIQVIFMDEENVGEVPIAKLNYQGDKTPTIVLPLTAGSFNLLRPELKKENNSWFLYVTQRQDYETLESALYILRIQIENEVLEGQISLWIVNIDDNPPIIHLLDACVVPELGDPRLTNCTYEVTDIDGRISTSNMTFKIGSDRDDENFFYFIGEPDTSNWNRMTTTLGINRALDFEASALHIFTVTALDSLNNNHTVTMMVQVQNVEHRMPRWVVIFAVQQIDELKAGNFNVRAIDGDTGINKRILYKIETERGEENLFDITNIEGGYSGGIFQINPIDRDALEKELFQVTLTAYKYDNETFSTSTNVVIRVNDINNKKPEPLHSEYNIAIAEETPQTLYFDKEFGFHDRDLGPNARYTVHLESVYPDGVADAFFIQPETGYQRQIFIMGTSNHSMLDFEVEEFQHIQIKVVATDIDKPDFIGVAIVNINLTNWNDELPIFSEGNQIVSFNETEGEGFRVAQVLARDRDIGDRVIHSVLGNAQNFLRIDNETGEIFVSKNNSFDYQRQSEIFVQVLAEDTLGEPYNTATSQLVIRLKDINNTPPSLRLPRGSTQVQENVPAGYVINDQPEQFITATDPDTTANLTFLIIWETSYAMKRGTETDKDEIEGCLDIVTSYVNDNKGQAVGRLVVKEIRPNVTIDYEKFEVLYLTVRVVDTETEIGEPYDELTFTITILDMNDNPPVWVNGTLEQTLRVREKSGAGTIIGTVTATDADGPQYNQVRYTIVPREDTPEDLVKIDFDSGQLAVDRSGAIDADEPRDKLYYTILASDRCSQPDNTTCGPDSTYFITEGKVTIQIIDTNDQIPRARTDRYNTTVYIHENAEPGKEVVTLVAEDGDRDVMYNTIRYQINYGVNMRLNDFFAIEPESGRVYVHYTTHEVLDRDGNEPTHRIFFTLIDNFNFQGDGNRNQNTTDIEVILLDVNDNAPQLPLPNFIWSISENAQQGIRLNPGIFAEDRDEPNTDNSRVGYEITNLTLTNRDITPPELFTVMHVFISDNIYNVSAELEVVRHLKGFWGNYDIGIRAFDHGVPRMESSEIYQITIIPYNFESPKFKFPLDAATLRFSKERALVNSVLVLATGELLERVSASDSDGLQAGEVTFEVVGDELASEHFRILNNGDNIGTLLLTQPLPTDQQIIQFELKLRATDGGLDPGPLSSEVTVKAVFVPTQGEPIFPSSTASVAFVEKEVGLTERQQLPLAEDPKNHLCDKDCRDIYYAIISGNNDGIFALDPVTNVLTLNKALNRSESESHVLRVATSNEKNISPSLATSVIIVTVNATHSDGAQITYSIDFSSMQVDPSLNNVRNTAFILNSNSGLMTLNIQPTASMQGMFEFNVLATDPQEAFDTSAVKIYVVSSRNRVSFLFLNMLQQIEQMTDFIASTFTSGFNMTCNIDQVLPATDEAGSTRDNVTEVRAHFIKDDVPAEASVIEALRGDISRLRLIQGTLISKELVLQDLVTDISPSELADGRALLYTLAAVAGVMTILLLVTIVVYFWRTRVLNRRLQALSMTKYGSQDSGLNRLGLAAPGTNKHAVEGSNPIWNESIKAPDFDALSETSDDSDLIGIENLEQFRDDYFPPVGSDSAEGVTNTEPVSTHLNNFGFNPTPFTPEFANKPRQYKI
ncbi:cadherin membrane protein precursor [Danaus plexippus plexippus]|uniref:Cadherin membrane protein n=1 Tax=Danaus plexippus plexippus TaxID=278856 RepID=A0A212EM19_DANPL|nr:cadherin membrane protein precursor [Danaus plexippus plexippus]